ncbi:tetratricopeptide repeat protein [Tunturiibacter empetritectus]|uniref:Tetratricopeptide (TPR) repeat protein n=1 Tax=Tunturiibacter lichenicola TaxID=2051959 RepID=A0A852VJ65_9BACT|nr:tetratricopeptide repeat protein [Edaphobacter lichenicola]NYF90205.1 tetratricopeptide (TPR) repeat protein [Edaphobacter lichenicola]
MGWIGFLAFLQLAISAVGQTLPVRIGLLELNGFSGSWVLYGDRYDQTSGKEARAENSLQQARDQIKRSEFAAAEQVLRTFLQREPASADALYLLGEVLMRRDQPKESLRVFTQAAAERRPTGEELRLVGLDYVLLQDYADAIRWLKQATDLSPGDADTWYSLGRAQYSKGDYGGAETSFRRVLTLDSRSVKAENNLGLTLASQNHLEKAMEAYRKAEALQQGSALQSEQPLLNLGLLLLDRNQPQEAAEKLARAAAIAPSCAQCQEALGQALLALNRLTEAEAAMEKAVALEPKNPRFHFVLGRAYKQSGEVEKSKIELQKSAELYGSHSTTAQ